MSTGPPVTRLRRITGASPFGGFFDSRFRIAFVLFGGMLVLQSSPTLDVAKIAYMVGCILCFLAAALAVWRVRKTSAVGRTIQWLGASAALTALIAISFFVARAEGTPLADWVRDVAAYALFAAVPVLALDGQPTTSRRLLVGMLIVAGLLGGLSWAVEWLSRRHILELPLARLVFPSGQLPGLLYLYAAAMAMANGRRATAWVMLAGLVLGLFLVTGTRSSLLLLSGPLVMAALIGRSRVRSSLRSFVSHCVVAVVVVLVFQTALALPTLLDLGRAAFEPGSPAPTVTFAPVVVGDRIGRLPSLVGSPASDPSFRERLAQYRAAWTLFVSSPIVGVGPGHPIQWINVSGNQRAGFAADTPLVMPAKFGLLGIFVFLGAALAYGSTVLTALRRNRRSVVTLTLVGYGTWTVLGLPLGFPVEDKGASLALMLLLALTFAEWAVPAASVSRSNLSPPERA